MVATTGIHCERKFAYGQMVIDTFLSWAWARHGRIAVACCKLDIECMSSGVGVTVWGTVAHVPAVQQPYACLVCKAYE